MITWADITNSTRGYWAALLGYLAAILTLAALRYDTALAVVAWIALADLAGGAAATVVHIRRARRQREASRG